jgi:predicted DNA binding protein
MPTITDITLPGESFALGRLLTENPDIRIELERLVPLGDRLLPFFWVSGRSPDHIKEVLESQDIVESVELLTEVEERYLFQVTWSSEVDGLVDAILDTDGVIIEGQGLVGKWEFRLRFPDHESLSEFRDLCEEKEIPVLLRRIYNPHYPKEGNSMTSEQQEAILTAYERGYFDIPRGTSMTELARVFDISDSAYSQRLRRGLASLIYETMVSN